MFSSRSVIFEGRLRDSEFGTLRRLQTMHYDLFEFSLHFNKHSCFWKQLLCDEPVFPFYDGRLYLSFIMYFPLFDS